MLTPVYNSYPQSRCDNWMMQLRSRRTLTATISLLALLLAVTVCRRSPTVARGELSTAEYDVLSAWVTGTFTGQGSREGVGKDIGKIVVFNMTESGEDGQNLRMDGTGQPIPWTQTASSLQNKVPTLQRTTIDAYREVNAQKAALRRSFQPSIEYELVDSAQLEPIFKRGGGDWLAFYKQFPGSQGVLTFSRVGFSADGTEALFFLSNHCGGLCGTGRYVVMEKRNGRWVIEKEIEMWVS